MNRFSLTAFTALAVALVMVFADTLGQFYESPSAAPLTRGVAVAFFFQALAVVPAAFLLKRFRFAVHESLQTISGFDLDFYLTCDFVAHHGPATESVVGTTAIMQVRPQNSPSCLPGSFP